jgi:hypothetical protein
MTTTAATMNPYGEVRDGLSSTSRTENGARVHETRHTFRGIEITISQRMELSDDGKTLLYSEQIHGPKSQGYRHTVEFDVAK